MGPYFFRGMLFLLVMMLLVPVTNQEDYNFVTRFRNGIGFHYMVFNYSFANVLDYVSTTAPSTCLCIRRCQVVQSCQAVSSVPLEGEEGVECRTSGKPGVLHLWRYRPQLIKTLGAIHILKTDETEWPEPENDGLFYTFHEHHLYMQKLCPPYHEAATAKNLMKYKILEKKMNELQDDRGVFVGLMRNYNYNNGEAVWLSSSIIEPKSQVYYSQSGLSLSALQNVYSHVYYVMKKENSSYVFIPNDFYNYHTTLCVSNRLNLHWP